MAQHWKGIFPALVTPFDKEGRILRAAVEKLVEVNIKKGVSGFYVGGSTGESYLLSIEERKEMLEYAVGAVGGRVDLIANIGMISTEQTLELARHAEGLGVSAVSAVPPFYFPFTPEERIAYYHAIADAVSVPVIVYNIPALSGVQFSRTEVERLFAHEGIAGMKHTSFDLFFMQKMIEEYPEKTVFIGHDEIFLSAWAAGARAAIGSTFNFMADKFIKMAELAERGEYEKALKLQGQVNDVVTVLSEIGVFKGVKAALSLQGIDVGECRKPFLPLKEEEMQRLREVLKRSEVEGIL